MFIIIPTNAHVSSIKLILKLLWHVSVFLHHPQGAYKLFQLDIKDLYVNLPIQNVINITKFWLNKNNNKTIIKQTLNLIKVILSQNYFQYNDQYFQPIKGIAMGSPISSTIAEIYLQFFEELFIRHWMESGEISYYKRYVDEILIIFD